MTSKSDPSSIWADRVIAETYRADWGRLLSLLVARTRRLDLAEDALSEAFARASARWPPEGVPPNPGGWIYTTAYRLILGRLRAEA
ncbi:MAG: sigma factor, partial [Acidimicrobiales bacterium]